MTKSKKTPKKKTHNKFDFGMEPKIFKESL